MLVYRIWQTGWTSSLSRLPQAWAGLMLVGLLLAIPVPSHHFLFAAVSTLLCMWVVLPAVVLLGASREPGRRAGWWFQVLGLASYPLYILHSPVMSAWNATSRPLGVAGGYLVLLALFLTAVWLDRVFDAPVRSWLSSVLRAGTGERRSKLVPS